MLSIKEYAMDILKEHGCDEYTYGGTEEWCKAEKIAEELKQAYPNGMKYPYIEVAKAIRGISKKKAKDIQREGFDFDDWGKWGIGDFYEETETQLRTAIASGEPFNTGWHGFRKEEHAMMVCRGDDKTVVCVCDCMDSALEQTDLFCDFLTNEETKMLTDEKLEKIRDCLIFGDFCEETSDETELPVNASFDEIIDKASKLAEGCRNRLHESFGECIAVTLYCLYGESDETMKLIEQRKLECGVKG